MITIGTLDRSLGTSPLVTESTVGADPEVPGAISIRFSLSVNSVPVLVLARAHPSGTLTDTLPRGATKGTYTWLSGMSPGAFDSVPSGVGADAGELGTRRDGPLVGWLGVGVAVTPLHPVSSAVRPTTNKPAPLFAPNFMT